MKNPHATYELFDKLAALAFKLVQARIARGWTQQDLARRYGTTEQQIHEWEATSYAGASLQTMEQIANLIMDDSRGNH